MSGPRYGEPAAGGLDVYADRNIVVQAYAQLAEEAGWPVAWGTDPSEPDWPVLYIETPTGQVSWHIPKAERIYEPPIRPEHGPVGWDGHTNEEKTRRLAARLTGKDPLATPDEPVAGLDGWMYGVVDAWLEHWANTDHRYGQDFAAFVGERLLTDFELRQYEQDAHAAARATGKETGTP